MAGFLHGVEVLEIDAGPRPIRTISTGIIGVVGTAPAADDTAFPLNTPVMVAGSRREAALLDTTADGTGGGTLPPALDGIFDQIGAVVIVVRVEEGADEAETLANIIGGVNAGTGQFEGLHALVGAESVVGHAPRILCAPGWTHQRPSDLANPVVAELEGIADRIGAVIIADGPNTTDAAAQTYAGDWGTSGRVYVIDPWVKVLSSAGEIVDEPASARVAGVISRTDNDIGFWVSPSNQGIYGIVGTSRPVDFKLGDQSSRANLLNANAVTTIIRQDGFRLWGNQVPTADAKWQFLCVRRTADVLNESIQRAHLWAVDRAITKTYIEDVVEGVNGFIALLVAQGALLGGNCWADPDLNTAASIQNGQVWFNFDFTPPYPAERVTFRSHLVNDYISEALA
jgi:phage tail sheath protein FI